MARLTTILSPLSPGWEQYSDPAAGWDGLQVTVTDLPDSVQLIEISGAVLNVLGGGPGDVIINLPLTLRPGTNRLGHRARVNTNGDLVLVGPKDAGGTVSLYVSYTR